MGSSNVLSLGRVYLTNGNVMGTTTAEIALMNRTAVGFSKLILFSSSKIILEWGYSTGGPWPDMISVYIYVALKGIKLKLVFLPYELECKNTCLMSIYTQATKPAVPSNYVMIHKNLELEVI